jgi:hypothetical protein
LKNKQSIQLKNLFFSFEERESYLFLWDGVLARVNLQDDVVRVDTVDLAAGGLGSAQNLLDGSLQLVGHRAWSHLTGNGDDLVERNAAFVLDLKSEMNPMNTNFANQLLLCLVRFFKNESFK